MSTPEPTTTAELVKLARQLERLLARRRTLRAKLGALDAQIVTTRRFINDLTRPFVEVDAGELPVIPTGGSALDGA